jgi:glucosamine-6-phosphate deaminase
MEIVIRKLETDAAGTAAQIIADELRAHPALVLGLATGRTMETIYRVLVRLHRDEGLDFSRCRTFNLDEYVGVPAAHRTSYHWYMNEHLFRHVNLRPENVRLPDGMAADLEAECRRYESFIQDCGGIDIQLLGLGGNGHIGFNEPPADFQSRTHIARLAPATLDQNGVFFGGADKVPRRAITVGVATIMESRRAVLVAGGTRKAEAAARALEGPVTPAMPASILQTHPACTAILDESAAIRLQRRTAQVAR